MSTLLRHPQFILGEGPIGYLLRLANANGLVLADLKSLGIFFHPDLLTRLRCLNDNDHQDQAYANHIFGCRERWPQLRNVATSRWCPRCLEDRTHWHGSWEFLFIDACPKHQCWLVDRCDGCGMNVGWARKNLFWCDCGRYLASNQVSLAPGCVVRLANDLELKLLRSDATSSLTILSDLDFEQVARLVRLIGSYGQPSPGRRPQKIRALGDLTVSWQVTSIAAEVLGTWPTGFQRLLRNLLDRETAYRTSRLTARFGHFYASLFRRFPEREFDFLRHAFEVFLGTHWESAIARRNSRLSDALIRKRSSNYVPCARLGLVIG